MLHSRLNAPYGALRGIYGVVTILAKLDKFTNLLTNWEQYLSPLARRVFPFFSLARLEEAREKAGVTASPAPSFTPVGART